MGLLREHYVARLLYSCRRGTANSTKINPHGHKVMLSVFWGSQGILFWELLEENERANVNVYMEQLQKLVETVHENTLNLSTSYFFMITRNLIQ